MDILVHRFRWGFVDRDGLEDPSYGNAKCGLRVATRMTSDSFNLNPPPGFRGLLPDIPVHIYHRHLPHWRQNGATYFVTFRLADAIPQQHLSALKRWRATWEREHPEPRSEEDWEEFARAITSRSERWMDEGFGECVFQNPDLAKEMSSALLHFQGDRCETFGFVVMPNHVHAIIKPIGTFRLEQIVRSVKGFVARKVNTALKRTGQLWEPESHDRAIRDEEHLYRVIQYIGKNPAKAHLPTESWVRWIHPEWEKCGWVFQDVAGGAAVGGELSSDQEVHRTADATGSTDRNVHRTAAVTDQAVHRTVGNDGLESPSYGSFIENLHATPTKAALAVTGGGAAAISELLAVPGASGTVLEAIVPYSKRSLESFLGGACDSACSEPTVRALAMAAWMRARQLVEDEEATPPIGVACTASLASNRPKRGPHRAHLALQTTDETRSLSITFEKGARSRAEEERLTADLILNLIAQACGVDQQLPLEFREGEKLVKHSATAGEDLCELIAGSLDAIFMGDGIEEGERHTRGLIFPGAFNPLHEGHRQMAEVAAERMGLPVEFELAIVNVDKPPLDYIEIDRRVGQFGDDPPLWLTRTATFIEKSRLFPRATFVVGADTIVRIANPLYYGGEAARDVAIAELADRACRFLVFGRLMSEEFHPLSNIELPCQLLDLCDEVPETDFRTDISSTELRKHER